MNKLDQHINSLPDAQIVKSILERDRYITYGYLYRKLLPLFSAVMHRYYTDCTSTEEFINQVYLVIMMPNANGKCKLESFSGQSSLLRWLQVVAINYCRSLYIRKPNKDENVAIESDRLELDTDSLYSETNTTDKHDVEQILAAMPNVRYREIIRLRYLVGLSNEETARKLGMGLDNFYNKHRLAKAQYVAVARHEGLI